MGDDAVVLRRGATSTSWYVCNPFITGISSRSGPYCYQTLRRWFVRGSDSSEPSQGVHPSSEPSEGNIAVTSARSSWITYFAPKQSSKSWHDQTLTQTAIMKSMNVKPSYFAIPSWTHPAITTKMTSRYLAPGGSEGLGQTLSTGKYNHTAIPFLNRAMELPRTFPGRQETVIIATIVFGTSFPFHQRWAGQPTAMSAMSAFVDSEYSMLGPSTSQLSLKLSSSPAIHAFCYRQPVKINEDAPLRRDQVFQEWTPPYDRHSATTPTRPRQGELPASGTL